MSDEGPLFYCQLCEEWSATACDLVDHGAYVSMPDPRAAQLNYLRKIRDTLSEIADKE